MGDRILPEIKPPTYNMLYLEEDSTNTRYKLCKLFMNYIIDVHVKKLIVFKIN